MAGRGGGRGRPKTKVGKSVQARPQRALEARWREHVWTVGILHSLGSSPMFCEMESDTIG